MNDGQWTIRFWVYEGLVYGSIHSDFVVPLNIFTEKTHSI